MLLAPASPSWRALRSAAALWSPASPKRPAAVLTAIIKEAVSDRASLICADQWPRYETLKSRGYFHRSVDHSAGQYIVGALHTQTIEGFWSLVKRGMVGTFHNVIAKYLPLYVAEFSWRYDNRHNDDILRAAISAC